MKLLCLLALAAASLLGQTAIRVDPQSLQTVSNQNQGAKILPVYALPYAYVTVCNAPANGTPCTNYAQTYTDASAATPCALSTQVVLAGTASCQNQTDGAGAFGFWLLPGQYVYTLVYQSNTYGPYSLTVGYSGYALSIANPVVYSTNFNFTPQAPGTALTASAASTITMSPCPAGVNGTDTKHYLYLTGGTGTAEAVLITGGTCTSGATTGTIKFTPANNHSGVYTVGSATMGVTEGEYSLPATGGKVYIPYNISTKALIPVNAHITFEGSGAGTWITPSSSSSIIFDANTPTHNSCPANNCAGVFYGPSDGILFSNLVLNGQPYDGINGVYGVREYLPGGASDTQLYGAVGWTFENVSCNNVYHCIEMQRVIDVKISQQSTYANSRIYFFDSSYAHQYFNEQIVIDKLQQYRDCLNNDCTIVGYSTGISGIPLIQLVNCITCRVTNSSISEMGLAVNAAPNAIEFDGNVQDDKVTGITCEDAGVCVDMQPGTWNGGTWYPADIQIIGNACDGPWIACVRTSLGTGTTDFIQSGQILISDNFFSDPQANGSGVYLIEVQDYSRQVSILNNHLFDMQSSQGQYAVFIGAHVDHAQIYHNIFQCNSFVAGAGTGGILVSSTATNIYYGNLEDNVFDTVATPINDSSNEVTATTTLTLPGGRKIAYLTGTTPVTSINGCTTSTGNYEVTLVSLGATSITKGNNLFLTSNYTTTTSGSLSLVCNGSGWIETGRSQN